MQKSLKSSVMASCCPMGSWSKTRQVSGLGRGAPGRSTLFYANAHRPHELFEKLFYQLLGKVSEGAPKKKFRFKSKLYSLDSTVIDLCASMFDWAKFRSTKGAAKLHLLLDHDGCLPCYARITICPHSHLTIYAQLLPTYAQMPDAHVKRPDSGSSQPTYPKDGAQALSEPPLCHGA